MGSLYFSHAGMKVMKRELLAKKTVDSFFSGKGRITFKEISTHYEIPFLIITDIYQQLLIETLKNYLWHVITATSMQVMAYFPLGWITKKWRLKNFDWRYFWLVTKIAHNRMFFFCILNFQWLVHKQKQIQLVGELLKLKCQVKLETSSAVSDIL